MKTVEKAIRLNVPDGCEDWEANLVDATYCPEPGEKWMSRDGEWIDIEDADEIPVGCITIILRPQLRKFCPYCKNTTYACHLCRECADEARLNGWSLEQIYSLPEIQPSRRPPETMLPKPWVKPASFAPWPDECVEHEFAIGSPNPESDDYYMDVDGDWKRVDGTIHGSDWPILRPPPRRFCPFCGAKMSGAWLWACDACVGEALKANREWGYDHRHIFPVVQPSRRPPEKLLPKPWEKPSDPKPFMSNREARELAAQVPGLIERVAALEAKIGGQR